MPAVQDRKLARRATIALTVPDVDTAAGQVRTIAAAARGIVLAEAISSEPDSPELGGFSTITISVPTDALDDTMDRLAAVGEVHSRNTSTEDVTGQYVDTQSRIETMQASVERVRALMAEATRLADIVSLEAELSRRQADLESLQAQLAALEDAVDLAPIEVTLSTDETALEDRDDDTGFLAGLAAGWDAFTASVTVLLTALGALLPFAVLAALVAVPLLVWWRRRGTRPVSGGRAPGAPQRLTQRAETSWTRSTTRVSDVRVGVRQHPVAEVEDVPRRRTALVDDLSHPAGERLPGCEQQGRIEVPLDGIPATQPVERVRQRHPVVDTDDVRAGLDP